MFRSNKRKKQIEKFRSKFPQSKVVRENQCYDLAVDVSGPAPITLRITLEEEFPTRAPQVIVLEPVRHSLIDSSGGNRVTYNKLMSNVWTSSLELADVVGEIVQKLREQPPFFGYPAQLQQPMYAQQPQPHPTHHYFAPATANVAAGYGAHGYPQVQPQPASSFVPQQPAMAGPGGPGGPSPYGGAPQQQQPALQRQASQAPPPMTFPSLQQLSLQKLKAAALDQREYDRLLHHLPEVVEGERAGNDIEAENVSRAEMTLRMRDDINTLAENARALREENERLFAAFDALQQRQQMVLQRHTPQMLTAQLRSLAAAADDATESRRSEIEAAMGDPAALNKFVAERTRYWQLKHKADIVAATAVAR